jgi:hypothetical protein
MKVYVPLSSEDETKVKKSEYPLDASNDSKVSVVVSNDVDKLVSAAALSTSYSNANGKSSSIELNKGVIPCNGNVLNEL